ncbi:hypothetical protein F5Y00DRAFT_165740 [Daldinia vernicosa]|uniref:uncharacterized protein n=1 Tax=Daldinia vernicosa TaxID=114800 RepID=UPI002008CEC1|nr:uncharacterized protein F5Y00DRAFT_165740 [Daldinia vernicosa]KAI0845621.1 hypothetical protein F5Y00DRAFT_165740 [Daldinia vernicosa]
MDLSRGSGDVFKNSLGSVPSPAEDDEIPLDSSSEESDVSMSDSESEVVHNSLISTGIEHISTQAQLPVLATQRNQDIPKKRKSQEAYDAHHALVSIKKVKLDNEGSNQAPSIVTCPLDKSLLPAEIWHRIFTFTPPRALGNLLCVNKLFSVYLDPSSPYQCKFPPSLSQSSSRLLKPDAIWQLSRRRFWPRMPTPLQQKTELYMWRLACGRRCQFCGETDLVSANSSHNQRHQPIWPFALRSCESCLVEKTMKEIDLLLSSTPSLLMSALPFTFITNENRVISPDALQKGVFQPDMQVTKIYLSEHVEKLKQEFLSAKSMGGATAEEWLKGLEARGKELLNDSMRWEKWASTGGVAQMQTPTSLDNASSMVISNNKGQVPADSSLAPKTPSSSSNIAGQHAADSSHVASVIIAPQPARTPEAASSHELGAGIPSLPINVQSSGSRTRTREEALELKAARRTEIERRAMELDPPLPSNILEHIPAFQAAIQIITPLDDYAWDLLKPRLLAQRTAAEQRERREQGAPPTQSRLVSAIPEEHGQTEENAIVNKQLVDKAWDDVQEPLRAQISAFADEIIRDNWNDGQKVDTDNSPQFAAEVLLHVRKKFYAEIERESAAARAAGREPLEDPPEGPFTQKLTLENMKWLFDVKIKPHTESYRKDLFFCNGCEISFKAFGFEGVIQHYAAKHTQALSQGSVVVHWRAEWPEIPPFRPDPHIVKPAPAISTYGTLQPQGNAYPHLRNAGPHSTSSNPSPFQPSPYAAVPPSYGHPAYGPTMQQPAPHGYGSPYIQGPHEYGSPYPHYGPPYGSYEAPYHSLHPSFSPGMQTESPTYPPATTPYHGHSYTPQNNSQISSQSPHGNFFAGKYRAQLDYLARNSRELWTSTAGLKELPGDIRVHVVIWHVVQKFRSKFYESPPLSMFIDGLSNNKEMRPVRNVNGLMCKACHLSLSNEAPTEQDLKAFSLPQLVNHFQQRHVDQPQMAGVPFLDWTVNMVHMPDLSALSNIQYLANIDGQKSSLIYSAFPSAQYPNSYLQGVYAVDTRVDVGTGAFAGRQPTSIDSASFYPATRHDETNSTIQQDPTQATTLGQKLDFNQVMVVDSPSLTAHQKLQHSDSGRSSSEAWQGNNAARTKKQRRSSTKDRRNTSSQGSRNRKSGALDTSSRVKSQEPSEGDLITEEERRQEEEIRAMWAADRREAALVASKKKPPNQIEEPSTPNRKSETGSPISHYVPPPQSIGPSIYAAQAARPQQLTITQERDEDDLMAGLESQLDKQQVLNERLDYRSRHDSDLHHKRQPPYGQYFGSERHTYSDQRHSYDRATLEPPGYVRHESRPGLNQYQENDVDPRAINPAHGSTRTPAPLDDALYDRPLRQEYYHVYNDDHRAHQPAPEYATAYEIVRVRDSHGEYVIKRPIRLEREPTYATSQDGPTPYNDAAAQYRSYGDEDSGNRLRYESDLRTEPPPRQHTYEAGFRAEGNITKRTYEAFSRDDATGYDDYDPRYPSGPPNSNIERQPRYQ